MTDGRRNDGVPRGAKLRLTSDGARPRPPPRSNRWRDWARCRLTDGLPCAARPFAGWRGDGVATSAGAKSTLETTCARARRKVSTGRPLSRPPAAALVRQRMYHVCVCNYRRLSACISSASLLSGWPAGPLRRWTADLAVLVCSTAHLFLSNTAYKPCRVLLRIKWGRLRVAGRVLLHACMPLRWLFAHPPTCRARAHTQ